MDNQLLSISKIFTERLYRIPDYQRGYAWTDAHLRDFYNDILQLEIGKNHYVGVLTLEKVPEHIYTNWEDDFWIIKSKSFDPYYVVDGQQRLTTTIILIQAILEVIGTKSQLNFTDSSEIRKKFIFDSKDGGISRSYIFGYEKDNPSYEFLKKTVFKESSSSGYNHEETIYTHNLEYAKNFFINQLEELNTAKIEAIYTKTTQHLLFNIYTITEDIDVFVAFETMNNRGKPLSNLELLKNRLIYLSTKFDEPESERNALRRIVNDSWKAIYHYLGKNKEKPLPDDTFLLKHSVMYFGREILRDSIDPSVTLSTRHIQSLQRENYVRFLLGEKFRANNINISGQSASKLLTINEVRDYAQNLQDSVALWYDFYNPVSSSKFNKDEKIWIDKLERIGILRFAPILLAAYLTKMDKKTSVIFLKLLEQYGFLTLFSRITPYWAEQAKLEELANELFNKKKKIQDVIKRLKKTIDGILGDPRFIENVGERLRRTGFYEWVGIKYFLYEYDLSLMEKSKTKRIKINWDKFNMDESDYVSIEHIYPQKPDKLCWEKHFKQFTPRYRRQLQDSLGNLLPLSIPKNSSLQNICFQSKVDNGKHVGYRFGSYSENEISNIKEWTSEEILARGIKLLKFMETRWGLSVGNQDRRISVLNLNFLQKSSQI